MYLCSACKADETKLTLWPCESCNNKFCQNCAKLTASEVKCLELKKFRTLCFYCEECQDTIKRKKCTNWKLILNEMRDEIIEEVKNDTAEYKKIIEEQSLNINKLREEIRHLSEKMKQFDKPQDDVANKLEMKLDDIRNKVIEVKENQKESPESYANIVSKKNSILVKPKDGSQSVLTTKSVLLQNANPISEKINIDSIKNVGKGGIVINCPTKEEADKFKNIINERLAEKYDVNSVNNIQPRIRIAGITEKHENETLLKLIRNQNKMVIQDDDDIKLISFKPIKNKNQMYQIVLGVNPLTYKRVIERGYIFIGYDHCQVFDGFEIKRCFRCCGFHHAANKCDNRKVCPRCTENHDVKECKAEVLKCNNCVNFNLKSNNKIDTNHATWDNRCHCYKQKLEEFKSQLFK